MPLKQIQIEIFQKTRMLRHSNSSKEWINNSSKEANISNKWTIPLNRLISNSLITPTMLEVFQIVAISTTAKHQAQIKMDSLSIKME
jgi:hypothetical protein